MRPDPAGSALPSRRLLRVRPRPVPSGRALSRRSARSRCSPRRAPPAAAGMGTVSGTITIAAVPGHRRRPALAGPAERPVRRRRPERRDQGLSAAQSAELAALENDQAEIAASDYGNIFAHQQAQPNLPALLADGYDAGRASVEILTPARSTTISTALDLQGAPIGLPERLGRSARPRPACRRACTWRRPAR